MSADDFVFSTLIAHHPDPATASRALAMAEAAVLRRAADALNALPQDYECDPGWGDAAERLRRTADGIEEKTGPAAREEGKSSQPADATPRLTGRRARLLDAIRTHGGRWDTGRVLDLYGLTEPGHVLRVTARRDLDYLHWGGHLVQHGPQHGRFYTLKTRRGGRS
ncbi:hypothetical protein ACFZCV_20845 [Streptomyces sp. NPDC007920]|uniref:hypothetical protein n=1 Tax=Streptomyces sp. NPDC007920 TaxID=3364794 RepID=UPI0036EC6065